MEFSLAGARALLLAAQGLLQPPSTSPRKADVLGTIRRLGVLQIDSIHVIARSHLLVLWSRLGAYNPAWLDELLAEGALFEGWAHAACFIPIEDFSLYRPGMLARHDHSTSEGWLKQHPEVAERVLNHLRVEGPVRAGELEQRAGPAPEVPTGAGCPGLLDGAEFPMGCERAGGRQREQDRRCNQTDQSQSRDDYPYRELIDVLGRGTKSRPAKA